MGLYTYGSHEFEQSLQAKSGDPPDLRCELEQELRAEICCIRDELLYIYSMELEFLIAGQDRLYAAAFQCRGPDNRHRPSAVGPVFSCWPNSGWASISSMDQKPGRMDKAKTPIWSG
jgi:hypothetical protein